MRLNTLHFFNITVVALLFSSARISANEERLYAEEPPAGSAFVRIFNSSQVAILRDATISNKLFGKLAGNSSSPYLFFSPGEKTFSYDDNVSKIQIKGDEHYTLVVIDGLPSELIKDGAFRSKRKARVSLYNLVTKGNPLTLRTADGKTALLSDVKFLKSDSRNLNALRIPLAVYSGGDKIAEIGTISFERGKATSVFVGGAMENPVIKVISTAM